MWWYLTKSTLKREFAGAIMLWYLSMGTWLMMRVPVNATIPDASMQTWSALQAAVFGLAGAAFIADFVAKQTNWGGPPANTETTVKTEITDNSATQTVKAETVE